MEFEWNDIKNDNKTIRIISARQAESKERKRYYEKIHRAKR
jgi:uncharacterized DUF497 family protein